MVLSIIWALALSPTCWVTLGKLLSLSRGCCEECRTHWVRATSVPREPDGDLSVFLLGRLLQAFPPSFFSSLPPGFFQPAYTECYTETMGPGTFYIHPLTQSTPEVGIIMVPILHELKLKES